jgi:hypothetical protein
MPGARPLSASGALAPGGAPERRTRALRVFLAAAGRVRRRARTADFFALTGIDVNLLTIS